MSHGGHPGGRLAGVGSAVALAAALAAALLLPLPVQAQEHLFGLEGHFKGYSFDEGLGADAAQLVIFPAAYRLPVGERLQLDFYSAWARGQVEQDGTEFTLDGFVDTQLKASWRATPWAVVSLAANLPTGNSSHTSEEAVVAALLSSDLLGFRETTWGTGLSLTSGVATAARAGSWGLGAGASYRMASEFEPSADTALGYEPGDEIRFRFAADRNVGETGKLTFGTTFQNFSQDQLEGRNLFQAGNRLIVDASYAARMGSEVWTFWAADVWRESGDRSFDLIDPGSGTIVGDTTVATGSQNLVVAGVNGAVPVAGLYRLRPSADVRLVTRDNPVAPDSDVSPDEGSGWILSVGADFPIRLFGDIDVYPRASFLMGDITARDGDGRGVTGASGGVNVRWTF